MPEENPQATGVNEQNPPEQPPAQIPQAEIDRIAAAARREAEAKLKAAQERLDALEAEKKKRELEEMTELEKIQAERDELNKKLEGTSEELEGYKVKVEAHETAVREKVDKETEGLTDNQKEIVSLLPLDKQLDAIAEYKAAVKKPGSWGKGSGPDGVLSIEEINQMRAAGDKRWTDEYRKYKKAR